MRELVGTCRECGKAVYCENGFLNGILLPGHEYLCYPCDEAKKEREERKKE